MRDGAVLALAIVLGVGRLGAQQCAMARDTQRVILTVSGGSSRGAYQAGLNWGLVELTRRATYDDGFCRSLSALGVSHIPRVELTAVGGASAGNINGLLSAIDWCRDVGATRPDQNILWQVWVWTGWEQLTHERDVVHRDEQGLFDRWFFSQRLAPALRAQYGEARFRPHCRVPIGITATRLLPDTVSLATDVTPRIQRFGIPFSADADASGKLRLLQPSAAVLDDPTLGPLLVLADSEPRSGITRETIGFHSVFNAVEASSAAPIFFAPRTLRYFKGSDFLPGGRCQRAPNGPLRCSAPPESAQFVDGGVFDNNPLGLAYGLHRCVPEAHRTMRQVNGVCADDGSTAILIYVDPDTRRNANGSRVPTHLQQGIVEGFSSVQALAGGIYATAREYELAVFDRTRRLIPGADKLEIVTTDRFHAIVGDQFNGFGAFLGRPFREYDFDVGMYDALRFAAAQWFCGGQTHADGSASPGTSRRPKDRACDDSMMRDLLQSVSNGELLDLDPVTRHVLATLYAQEFPGHPLEVPAEDPSNQVLRDRMVVLDAVAHASDEIRRLAARGSDSFGCRQKPFLQALLCKNGFSILLDSLRAPGTRPAVERLASDSRCHTWEQDVTNAALDQCRVDVTLMALVEDPVGKADEVLAGAQRRAALVESGRQLEWTVELLQFAYGVGGELNARGFSLLPSSIPEREWGNDFGLVSHLLPFQLSGGMWTMYYVVGYRPTLYGVKLPFIGGPPKLAFVLPLEWARLSRETALSQGNQNSYIQRTSVGAGVAYLNGSLFLSTVQLSGFVADTAWQVPHFRSANVGGELSATLLGGKLRVAARLLPSSQRGEHWYERVVPLVGLSDFNGLTYWIVRLIRRGDVREPSDIDKSQVASK